MQFLHADNEYFSSDWVDAQDNLNLRLVLSSEGTFSHVDISFIINDVQRKKRAPLFVAMLYNIR